MSTTIYQIHELIVEHIEDNTPIMRPREIRIPDNHAVIPPGVYLLNEDNVWMRDVDAR